MAKAHAFASARQSFTVPAIKRASVWHAAPRSESAGSPAAGILIAAAAGAALWYGILLLVL